MAAYQSLLSQAGQAASTPYTPYTGQLVAPFNPQQNLGVAGINQYANFAQPYIQQAAGLATSGATPITAQQIQQYESPYTQQVVNATQAQFNNQNAQQQQGVLGNAIAQGALGGNRVGITQAELANQQQLAQAPVIAGLENQGYQTGLNTALTEQQAQAAGAYSLGNLGVSGQNAGLTGAGAQLGAGTAQQQTQQAQDAAAYQQFLNQLAYPFQTTQWLAGVDTGVGSQMGGTSTGTTTGPAPSTLGGILGGAGTLIGGLGTAGAFAPGGMLAFLSTGGAAGRARGGVAPETDTTIPESHETLVAQQHQLIDGHRRVQMFPHGTPELRLPHGVSRVVVGGDVFHYDPNKISAEQIKHLAANGRENELLDLGPVSKHEVMARLHRGEIPVAVVERRPDGTEVRAAAGTHVTAGHQMAAMHRTKSPENDIHIEDPRYTLAMRHHRSMGGGVAGYDTGGGVNYSTFGGGFGTPIMPYSGGKSWVPGMGITHGPGAPRASAPGGAGQQSSNPAQMGQQIGALAKAINGGFSSPTNISPSAQGAFTPSPVGTTMPLGVSPEIYSPTGSPIYRRGGSVGRYEGGVANLPMHNRIIVPHGYADGGSPDDGIPFDPTAGGIAPSFDQFGDAPTQFNVDPSVGDMARNVYLNSGASLPDAVLAKGDLGAPSSDFGPVSPSFADRASGEFDANNFAPTPTLADQGVANTNVPLGPMTSPGFGGEPSQPVTGLEAIPPARAQDITTPTAGYADRMSQYEHIIGNMEASGNYRNVTTSTNRHGQPQEALGLFGVMDFNLGPWSKEVLGHALTKQEFLNDPDAQKAIFRAKFGQYVNQYGPEGAARAWLGGPGGVTNTSATDPLGTSTGAYGRKFMAALNGAPSGVAPDGSTIPPNATLAQSTPENRGVAPASSGIDWSGNSKLWPALMAAGAGMLSSRSPFFANALGEGVQAGMGQYAAERQQEMNQTRINFEAQKLSQAADMAQKKLALETQQFGETQRQHAIENMKPMQIGQGILGPIYGVRDPSTGQFRIIDPKTGQVGPAVQPTQQPTPVPTPVPTPSPNGPAPAQTSNPDEDAAIPANARPVSGQGMRNEQFLDELRKQDPGTAALVQGIANYELDPSKVTSMRGGQRERIVGAVMQYDPSFSLPFYASRAAAVKEFNAGGPNSPAGTITAGNTAIQHLGELSDYGEKLGGASRWEVLNAPINHINATALGMENDPDYVRYENALGRFTEEATKFYRGIGGTESDIARAISAVTAAQSPDARRAAIAEQARLMQSKINALQDRYKTAMGGPPGWGAAVRSAGLEFPIMQQHSADAMKRILARETGDQPGSVAPTAAATQPAATALPAGVPPGSISGMKGGVPVWRTPDGQYIPKAQ